MEANVKGQMFSLWIDYCNYLTGYYTLASILCQHDHRGTEKGSTYLVIFVRLSGVSCYLQPARYLQVALLVTSGRGSARLSL